MGHTAWAPEGREGRSQRGPKGRKLEVGARRAPKLLVYLYNYSWGRNPKQLDFFALLQFVSCTSAIFRCQQRNEQARQNIRHIKSSTGPKRKVKVKITSCRAAWLLCVDNVWKTRPVGWERRARAWTWVSGWETFSDWVQLSPIKIYYSSLLLAGQMCKSVEWKQWANV